MLSTFFRILHSIKNYKNIENFCDKCCRFYDLDNYNCDECSNKSFVISHRADTIVIELYIWKNGTKISELSIENIPKDVARSFEKLYYNYYITIYETSTIEIKRKVRQKRVEFSFNNELIFTFISIPEQIFEKIINEINEILQN